MEFEIIQNRPELVNLRAIFTKLNTSRENEGKVKETLENLKK